MSRKKNDSLISSAVDFMAELKHGNYYERKKRESQLAKFGFKFKVYAVGFLCIVLFYGCGSIAASIVSPSKSEEPTSSAAEKASPDVGGGGKNAVVNDSVVVDSTAMGGDSLAVDSTVVDSTEEKIPSRGVFIDPRDGHEYPWAEIGDLVWMTRNMDYGTMIALEAVAQTGGRISGNSKHCYEALCALFGGLYSWEHAQSVCPKGWHLPSREEYEQLVQYAAERCKDGECDAVKSLKSGNEWNSPGTDETGFSALGGGKCAIKDGDVSCSMRKSAGHWWTSSSVEDQGVAMRITGQVAFPVQDKRYAYYSVRCVEDY